MKQFIYTLEIIIITAIITATIVSGVGLFYFVKYITNDPIYKEAYDVIKEKELLNENN